jgi:hypothetical protein
MALYTSLNYLNSSLSNTFTYLIFNYRGLGIWGLVSRQDDKLINALFIIQARRGFFT